MERGYFISFEGVDGCGKGTQIEKLKKYFEERGIDVLYTREPGGNVVAEKIRKNKERSKALIYPLLPLMAVMAFDIVYRAFFSGAV